MVRASEERHCFYNGQDVLHIQRAKSSDISVADSNNAFKLLLTVGRTVSTVLVRVQERSVRAVLPMR